MTHTQMAPAYVAASNKKCPLTVPLAVLGEVDAPVFDALTTDLAVQWPDESDVDPYDFDEITVEDGEIYFADEDRLDDADEDRLDELPTEPAPPLVTNFGVTVGAACTAAAIGILAVIHHFAPLGGVS